MKTKPEDLLAFCGPANAVPYDWTKPFIAGDWVYFGGPRAVVRVPAAMLDGDCFQLYEIAKSNKAANLPPVERLDCWTIPGGVLRKIGDPKPIGDGCEVCESSGFIVAKKECPTCLGVGRHACGCRYCQHDCTHCGGSKIVDAGPPMKCLACGASGVDSVVWNEWMFTRKDFDLVRKLPAVGGTILDEFKGTKAIRFFFDDGNGVVIGFPRNVVEKTFRENNYAPEGLT